MMAAFKAAVVRAASTSVGRPEHPDIPGARYVMFERFPYMLFYTVLERDVVVVAVEYATRDYVDRHGLDHLLRRPCGIWMGGASVVRR